MKNGHRPMRRQKREVTSPEELRRILEKCRDFKDRRHG